MFCEDEESGREEESHRVDADSRDKAKDCTDVANYKSSKDSEGVDGNCDGDVLPVCQVLISQFVETPIWDDTQRLIIAVLLKRDGLLWVLRVSLLPSETVADCLMDVFADRHQGAFFARVEDERNVANDHSDEGSLDEGCRKQC